MPRRRLTLQFPISVLEVEVCGVVCGLMLSDFHVVAPSLSSENVALGPSNWFDRLEDEIKKLYGADP
jgi:hypothetical protein